mgnify:CR=1 FL=1
MPIDYDIKGNWFHSRSSSRKGELDHIYNIVFESRNPAYRKLKWTENVPLAYKLAKTINIEPSTMRTKIRAFIRFGFLKDKSKCPIEMSELGLIWESLKGFKDSKTKTAMDDIEKLILSSSLSLYSFDKNGYQIDSSKGFSPLTELILSLNSKDKITRKAFLTIVGETNESYWRTDLIRSGMFAQDNNCLYYTGKFPHLFKSCKTVSWPTTLNKEEWEKIHSNLLDSKNPLSEDIKKELLSILANLRINVVSSIPKVEKSIEVIEGILEEQDEKDIEIGNYAIPDTYSQTRQRVKQNSWSKIVRSGYSFKCCVPECDSEGEFLVEASHIKPYRKQDDKKLPHRANPSNGLCLCPNCHKFFDKGFFSLSNDLKMLISSETSKLPKQSALHVIIISKNKNINPLPKKYSPKKEFLEIHRSEIFRK